jgi:hypothetical protein
VAGVGADVLAGLFIGRLLATAVSRMLGVSPCERIPVRSLGATLSRWTALWAR